MQGKARLKGLRMSPRKVRAVANQVRGVDINKAINFLTFCQRSAARPLLKLIRSAVSNISQTGEVDVNNLCVKELRVDAGPTMKRWMPRARGMATPILKRTSRVEVVVEEK